MSNRVRQLLAIILLLCSITFLGLLSWQDKFTKDYNEWLQATPTLNGKYHKQSYKVKKPVYDANFQPPITNQERVSSILKNNLNGVRYFGTLRTMNKHLNLNIYDGISNQIFNTGNAGAYPKFNFEYGNSTIAAHTYAQLGWNYYDGLTMIQHELDKNDKVYAYNGHNRYYTYEVMKKEVINANGGAYIVNQDRWKDKKVNPTGKPMLTMYDCYEPEAANVNYPTQRNVVYLHLAKVYDKKTVPKKIKNLFKNVPYYKYDNKSKTIKVKDQSRKGNWHLKWLDFLFKYLKIQYFMNWFIKTF